MKYWKSIQMKSLNKDLYALQVSMACNVLETIGTKDTPHKWGFSKISMCPKLQQEVYIRFQTIFVFLIFNAYWVIKYKTSEFGENGSIYRVSQ